MNFRQHQVKDSGFFVLSEGDAIKIIEEKLRKAKVIDENPTQKYTSKIQKHSCNLRKEKNFADKAFLKYAFRSDSTTVIWKN